MKNDPEARQKGVCARMGVDFIPAPGHLKVGISANVRNGVTPINGLRHVPEGDTTGWYLYAGTELRDDHDFFLPLHVDHLDDWCPGIRQYLGLPPGWRFLVADGYEDIWFDESLVAEPTD